jgi:hypothetical protein
MVERPGASALSGYAAKKKKKKEEARCRIGNAGNGAAVDRQLEVLVLLKSTRNQFAEAEALFPAR